MLTNHKKTLAHQIWAKSGKNCGFWILHGFLILPGNFRCHFANNFLCLKVQYYLIELKIHLESLNGHFINSVTPRLTPLDKSENDPKIQFFGIKDPIFLEKKKWILLHLIIMGNYRAMHHKWIFQIAILFFLSRTSIFWLDLLKTV